MSSKCNEGCLIMVENHHVRKSTKENRGIKHYAFTIIIIICQQNVIFFGTLSLRKGALKKNISR